MPEKCPHCEKQIEDSWEMKAYDGYVVWVDTANSDQFVHRHNFDGWNKADNVGKKAPKEKGLSGKELADSIIASMNDPLDDKKADKAKELLVRQAASIASKGGAQSIQAITGLASTVNEAFGRVKQPLPHEVCPLCKRGAQQVQKLTIEAATTAGIAMVSLRHLDVSPEIQEELDHVIDILQGGEGHIDADVFKRPKLGQH